MNSYAVIFLAQSKLMYYKLQLLNIYSINVIILSEFQNKKRPASQVFVSHTVRLHSNELNKFLFELIV